MKRLFLFVALTLVLGAGLLWNRGESATPVNPTFATGEPAG